MQTFRDEVGALLDPYQRQLYNLIAKPGVSFGHDSAGRLGLLPVLLALGVLRENGTPIRGLSSNGTENLHKARLQASSMPVTLGSRSGRSSPRATMSGMVKA